MEPVCAKVIAIPEMISGKSGDGQGLLNLLMENGAPSSFYTTTPARILIEYKWNNYARDELQMHFLAYAVFLCSYTIFSMQMRMEVNIHPFALENLEHFLTFFSVVSFFLVVNYYRYLDASNYANPPAVFNMSVGDLVIRAPVYVVSTAFRMVSGCFGTVFRCMTKICKCKGGSKQTTTNKISCHSQNANGGNKSPTNLSNFKKAPSNDAVQSRHSHSLNSSKAVGFASSTLDGISAGLFHGGGAAVGSLLDRGIVWVTRSVAPRYAMRLETEPQLLQHIRRQVILWTPLAVYFSFLTAIIASKRFDLLNMACLTVMVTYTICSIIDELKEMSQKSFSQYCCSVWNVFDVTLCVLNALTFVAYTSNDPENTLKSNLVVGVAVGILMAWIKIFYFCLPFRNVGSFIRMIMEIFIDTRYFLIVCMIALGGFGSAFFVLYKDDWMKRVASGEISEPTIGIKERQALNIAHESESHSHDLIPGGQGTGLNMSANKVIQKFGPLPQYANLPETLLGVYVLMLGDWDLGQFVNTEHPMLATFLFVLFTFVMMIILFNLLIAIMSDTFERVRENEESTFLKTRAETICDMQKLSFRGIKYQPWVHALLPQGSYAESGPEASRQWKGKLGEIKDLIKSMKKDFTLELEGSMAELRSLVLESGSKRGAGRGGKREDYDYHNDQ